VIWCENKYFLEQIAKALSCIQLHDILLNFQFQINDFIIKAEINWNNISLNYGIFTKGYTKINLI